MSNDIYVGCGNSVSVIRRVMFTFKRGVRFDQGFSLRLVLGFV